jgi:hypothetical protein
MRKVNRLVKHFHLKHGTVDMQVECHLIPGFMIGFEFAEEDGETFFVLDVGIIRLLFVY